jgi:hypothetical protein
MRRHTLELSGETIWHISTVFDVVKPRHGDCKISSDSAMAHGETSSSCEKKFKVERTKQRFTVK